MRAVVQRVSQARVGWNGEEVSMGAGLVIFLGIAETDTEVDADRLAEKITRLRVFSDTGGKFNLSAGQVGGAFLVIPQFTLFGDLRGQNRPSFLHAARPEQGRPLMDRFIAQLRRGGGAVEVGAFGAHMQVTAVNDGPVTLALSTDPWDPRIG